ncbi:MAG: radical SAM protein [Myxococcales bacterium]|nr:radical SAM protein [Myxococcales bacterium]
MDTTLVLTHDCNLGCPYCYAGEKFGKEMRNEVADAAIELALSDSPNHIFFSFFGGEPFLAFDAMKRATERAHTTFAERGIEHRFVVTTNGTALSSPRIDFLKRWNFFVGFSIDGTREAHAIRPFTTGKDSFDAVLAGLKAVQDAGIPYRTISVVDPSNVRYLGDTVEFLASQGVLRMALNPNYDAEWTEEDLEYWAAGYRRAAEIYVDSYRAGRPLRINTIDDNIKAHVKGGHTPLDQCDFGRSSVAVAPSGNLYPCERLVGEDRDHSYVIGNVFDGFSPRRTGLIETSGNSCDDCGDCALQTRCSSWCACANLADTGKHN